MDGGFAAKIIFLEKLRPRKEGRKEGRIKLYFVRHSQFFPNHYSHSSVSQSYAFTHFDLGKLNSISEDVDFQISKDVSLNLKKTSCKQFYKLFTENISIEPTAVTTWRKHCTVVADKWEQCIENNYKITRDNKLRQFYFKLLHRILVTNKELTRFGIERFSLDCRKTKTKVNTLANQRA